MIKQCWIKSKNYCGSKISNWFC